MLPTMQYGTDRPSFFMLNVGDIFGVFGAFMVVLIAIEIFINIRLYLGSSTLPINDGGARENLRRIALARAPALLAAGTANRPLPPSLAVTPV